MSVLVLKNSVTVVETNLLLSALINRAGLPQRVLLAWTVRRRWSLLTCAFQFAWLRDVTRWPGVAHYFRPRISGPCLISFQRSP